MHILCPHTEHKFKNRSTDKAEDNHIKHKLNTKRYIGVN